MPNGKLSTALRIASTLCWFSGILMVGSTVALGIPLLTQFKSPLDVVVFLLTFFVPGVLYCLCGRGIRRNSWKWGLAAIALSVVMLVMSVLMPWPHMTLLSLGILVSLTAGWGRLGEAK